jgi:ABC-type multidrug transport system ATPase subunit
MMNIIKASQLTYKTSGKLLIDGVSFSAPEGAFIGVIGENGAGKTTLVDLMMGFLRPSSGSIQIFGQEPASDPWETRHQVAYLSEKVDISGDWSIQDFLTFNKYFYQRYDLTLESKLLATFKVDSLKRVGALSAGEIRRAQIVAALAARPRLILIDEITAVLDIVGRQRFMDTLLELNRDHGCTIVTATNIMEDLAYCLSHVLILKSGRCDQFQSMHDFLGGSDRAQFSKRIVSKLEAA